LVTWKSARSLIYYIKWENQEDAKMAKLGFKDFLAVDYAPGMPDLIKKNAKKRKQDTTGGSNAEYSSTHTPRVDEVSQALGHKVAKARQAQASALRQKAVDEPDMMKAFAHTKAANKAERKAGQSYNRLMRKEEIEFSEEMTSAHKKLAYDVHKQLKRDQSMSPASGMKLKADHSMLRSKYGSDWRKKAGINEEVELDEYNTKSSKAIVTKNNKPVAIYSDLKSAQNDYHGKDGHAIGMRSHSAAMRIKKENPGIKIVESVEELDEALTSQQRRARARLFKKYKARIKLGRERAKRRFASPEKLKLRSRRKARDFIFRRITKDIPKSELTFARRQEIEKRLESPAVKKRIERLAIKFLPRVRKAEMEKKRKAPPKK